ncbi:putative Flp pilus-assembly TadE/G-like protein [Amycolatopsis sulphurea]|uniref:Putative Flp pilus-assembly TadE/G-like protein n=1 Tax=Amycolatopsis sulphurea TaxID=76022 RepID=A0A2A9FI84_9PSEU|nr:pilus assembly protein TadG-related protein [Amycolatopsis sulphurea]PFG50155.1 putative Flp pilus-assembly TadE/G-like protein [Amycolatopsis sulphurea]
MIRQAHDKSTLWWTRWSHWWRTQRRTWWRADDGRTTAFVVVLTIGILALAGLTLDGGLALSTKVKANGQAEAAARAGAQAIDLSAYRSTGTLQLVPAQAAVDAQSYLATVGASGTVSVSGDTVTVTITASHNTQLLGMVGISSLTVHGNGSAHPQRGVVTIDP